MADFLIGDMVIVKPDGRMGLYIGQTRTGKAIVQFGSSGPCYSFAQHKLRQATIAEIESSQLNGVGCNQGEVT
jgi:hypothetical protein